MKISKSILFAAAILWLVILASASFIFDLSSHTITMIYITGQGFLLALYIPFAQKSKKCKISKKAE